MSMPETLLRSSPGAAGQLCSTLRQLRNARLQLGYTVGVGVQAVVQLDVLGGKLVHAVGEHREIAQHPSKHTGQLTHPGIKLAVAAVQGTAALVQLGNSAVHGVEIGLHGIDVGRRPLQKAGSHP